MDNTAPKQPGTLEGLQSTLEAFIVETRKSFSAATQDSDTSFELLTKINTNLQTLNGNIEGLIVAIDRTSKRIHTDNKNAVDAFTLKTEEIKNEIAPKKIIIQKIPYFALWKVLESKTVTLLKKIKVIR